MKEIRRLLRCNLMLAQSIENLNTITEIATYHERAHKRVSLHIGDIERTTANLYSTIAEIYRELRTPEDLPREKCNKL